MKTIPHATKTLSAYLDDIDKTNEVLRRSKRQRKKKNFFGDDFYTYNVSINPISHFEAISSFDAKFQKEAIEIELESLTKNQT